MAGTGCVRSRSADSATQSTIMFMGSMLSKPCNSSALELVRKTLEDKRCPTAWLGDPFWQSGFPSLLSGLGDPELVRRLETLVQKETTRWVASKRRRIMSRKRRSNVRLERTALANRQTTR